VQAENIRTHLATLAERALDTRDPVTAIRAAELAGVALPKEHLLKLGRHELVFGQKEKAFAALTAAGASDVLEQYAAERLAGNYCAAAHQAWKAAGVEPPRALLTSYADTQLRAGNLGWAQWALDLIGEALPLDELPAYGDAIAERDPAGALRLYVAAGASERISALLDRALAHGRTDTAFAVFEAAEAAASPAQRAALVAQLFAADKRDAAMMVWGSANLQVPEETLVAYAERAYMQRSMYIARSILRKVGRSLPLEWERKHCIAMLRDGYVLELLINRLDWQLDPTTFVALAEECLRLRRPAEALTAFECSKEPVSTEQYLAIAACALQNRDLSVAETAYERAGQRIPDATLAALAEEHLARNEYPQALRIYERILANLAAG
jgi:hypothetical protein